MKAILLFLMLLVQGVSSFQLPFTIPSIWPTTAPPNTSTCSNKYGDQPAKLTTSISDILTYVNLCVDIPRRVVKLSFTDTDGNQRQACLLITSTSKRLPIIVWLHASLLSPSTIFLTNLVNEASSTNLTGKINGPLGYHLLVPLGRDTTHIYPSPDDKGLGWDNWYRNYNRSDPALNVDVQTIDYFIDQVVNRRTDLQVDSSRVFMSGWSNGAAMALQYALNTPKIAAAAVYSAPDPYRDYKDPCAQTPNVTYHTPVLTLYNQCDIIGICETGKAFIDDLNNRYGNKQVANVTIFGSDFQIKTTCNLACNDLSILAVAQHLRWPITLNENVFFNFLRKYSSV
ncbi:unnamed protein product [Rotaria magnacalcarata]|uniref:Phospholipase/carboxylesterase/thioesterase domain-containing protein n=1 Tax=Rotaria magnacalcarata TaxID=392030 RepID=A0A816TYA4_9BILA|nr:unnamed protein product [Rotaria magnacalcarata]CAF4295283.1 unnamed protein product [Rotaria magnacalcarata]